MDRFNFYKSSYDKEMIRKDELDKSINNPITIITLLVGFLTYIANKTFVVEIDGCSDYFLLFLFVLVFISISICILNIVRAYNNGINGHSYQIIGSNQDYEDYYHELKTYYKKKKKSKVENEFEQNLIQQLIYCADFNMNVNNERVYCLYLTKKYIVFSIIICFIIFIVFIIKNFSI